MQESTLTCPPIAPAGLKYCRGYRTRFWIRPESMSFRKLFAVHFTAMSDGVHRTARAVMGFFGDFAFDWNDPAHARELLVQSGASKHSMRLFGSLTDCSSGEWLLTNQPDATAAVTCADAEFVAQHCLHEQAIKGNCGVYFISNGRNAVKVGKSGACIKNRFVTLQTATPDPLQVVAVIADPDPAVLEKRLHAMLESKRIRGEWFAISDEEAVAIAIENGGRAISVLPH